MYYNKKKTFCIVINNVLSIVINIQNTTEPLILKRPFTLIYNNLLNLILGTVMLLRSNYIIQQKILLYLFK